jgi:hypothetical protein
MNACFTEDGYFPVVRGPKRLLHGPDRGVAITE